MEQVIKCRACLSQSDQMQELFEVFGGDLSLATIVENFLNVKIDPNDNLPKHLCLQCALVVINFYNFSTIFEKNNININKLVESSTDGVDKDENEFQLNNFIQNDLNQNEINQLQKEDLHINNNNNINKIKKKYICEICGYISYKKSYLTDHLEMHSEKPQYSCEFCPKVFRRRTVLSRHRRLHTQPRQYVCDKCGLKFNDPSTLNTHILLVHLRTNKFECVICEQTFSLKSTLEKHVKRHGLKEGVKEFGCEECGMKYFDKCSLKRHLLIKHN